MAEEDPDCYFLHGSYFTICYEKVKEKGLKS